MESEQQKNCKRETLQKDRQKNDSYAKWAPTLGEDGSFKIIALGLGKEAGRERKGPEVSGVRGASPATSSVRYTPLSFFAGERQQFLLEPCRSLLAPANSASYALFYRRLCNRSGLCRVTTESSMEIQRSLRNWPRVRVTVSRVVQVIEAISSCVSSNGKRNSPASVCSPI